MRKLHKRTTDSLHRAQLFVWSLQQPTTPLHRFADHTAAVKAIAWSPHQHGLLASGGGTADRTIRFWNTVTGSALSHVDTGSQVRALNGAVLSPGGHGSRVRMY